MAEYPGAGQRQLQHSRLLRFHVEAGPKVSDLCSRSGAELLSQVQADSNSFLII